MKQDSFNRSLQTLCGVLVLANLSLNSTAHGRSVVSDTQEEPSPATTIVIRFSIAPETLSGVGNSAELIAALRDNLMVEAATPLDSELTVMLNGRFGQESDLTYDFSSGITILIEPDQPVNGRFASLPIQTYGDWDEAEAWRYFRGETESGLVNSLLASGGFARDENGNVPLTVSGVHAGYWDGGDRETLGDRMLLELWPERRYKTGSRFGSPTPPQGYTEDIQVLVIELTPAPAETGVAASREPAEEEGPSKGATEPETITVSTESLDRLTGEYSKDGQSMVIRSDGENLFFSNPADPEYGEWRLNPRTEKDFWADVNGTRVELSFSIDDEGRVFAMTLKQEGFEITVPRLN